MIKRFIKKQFQKRFKKAILTQEQIQEKYYYIEGQEIVNIYQDIIQNYLLENPVKHGLNPKVNEILFLTQYYQKRLEQLNIKSYEKARNNYNKIGIQTQLIELELESLSEQKLGNEILKRVKKLKKEIKK